MKHWITKSGREPQVSDVRSEVFVARAVGLLSEIYNRNPNKASVDANMIWQQVVTSLNEQSAIRELLPTGGGFISK